MRSASANISKKQISFSLPEDLHAQVQAAAQSLGLSVSAWCTMAIGSHVRRWKKPESKAVWKACRMCGHKHNPEEHFK